jgi:hypothetical protein
VQVPGELIVRVVAARYDLRSADGSPVTQQYLIGQLSTLLEELQPPPGEMLAGAVYELRREVERSAVQMLPRLAREAIGLGDAICWAALERADFDVFRRYATAAAALGDFTENARLTTE